MTTNKRATILSARPICKQPGRYIGWPTIVKTREGILLVVFSGDREGHVCPWGKTQMVRSEDGGMTWSDAVTINNTPLDDRDAGMVETREGTLLLSWFTGVGFDQWPCRLFSRETYDSWRRHSEKINAETRAHWLGSWARRSTDGGSTWGEPIRLPSSTTHGATLFSDGRLGMIVGLKEGDDKAQKLIVSEDDGVSWKIVASIPGTDGPWGESHVIEAADQRLVALMRHQDPDINQRNLWHSVSGDGGRTWSEAVRTGMVGYPPHLVRLRDGRLLVVYGRRVEPFGIRACLSSDAGETWDADNEMVLSEAHSPDLGYPASVQLDDGSIYTVFYQIDKPEEKTSLMATHWRVGE